MNNLKNEFAYITGKQLPYNKFGLDVIELDKMFDVSLDKSCRQVLTEKYGKRAADIVSELLRIEINYKV